jgi:AraC-like DNA-binding protein
MNQQLNAAVRAHEEAGGAPSPYVLALVRAVLLRMSDVWKQSSEPPLSRHPLIGAVREHVRYSLSDSRLQVRGIAKALQCHPDYLSRLFHQETGTPLKVYIRAERIRAARQMLAYGTLSVKQIAFACGFQQSAYFIRVFKEVTGSTPRRLALNMTSSRPFLLPSR